MKKLKSKSKLGTVNGAVARIDKKVPIPIDKKVPIPARSNAAKWPFALLEVGDSFLVSGKTSQEFSPTAVFWRKKFLDRLFVTRTVEDGVRVWRVK